jgi:hypothetical protein
MSRWLAVAVMALSLIAAGYLFGMVCERLGGAYALILCPSTQLGFSSSISWCLLLPC